MDGKLKKSQFFTKREIECINSLDGIKHPTRWVSEAKLFMERLDEMVSQIEAIPSSPKAGLGESKSLFVLEFIRSYTKSKLGQI